MKKIISIIVFLLCAIAASAVSYASPYTGAGRSGYVYTTSSARVRDIGSAGLAQAPVASMSTTSSSSRGITTSIASSVTVPQIRVMQTSASSLTGGKTAADTYQQIGPARSKKSYEGGPGLPGGACDQCHWVWDEDRGCYVCTICGSNSDDGCDHMYYEGYCWCPIGDGLEVWAFIAALAGAYALYKVRTGKTSYGDVRDDREMVAG